ncbi:hypothetical protein [Listeria seeligeri]|uniref:hypothetical protein n=1 Tax=Listeria seeligeri TaxID=1640 RepID=UPI0022EB3FDC|nr:hypothetical protein [Listeria seeligeri]
MAKMRKVTTVRGYGAFVGANHLEVEETTGTGQEKTGTKKVIAFKRAGGIDHEVAWVGLT